MNDRIANVIPLLCLFGFYVLDRSLLRTICLIIPIVWIGVCLMLTVMQSDWRLFIDPAIIGIVWLFFDSVLKKE